MKQVEIEKKKEKRSSPMHESRNVDTSEKNAPSKIKIEYSFLTIEKENRIMTKNVRI